MTLLVGILLALAGWTLTRTFDLSTTQAVQLDKVDKLERHVEKLQDKMDQMMDKDEEIIEQHKKLFEALDSINQQQDIIINGTQNFRRSSCTDADENGCQFDRPRRDRHLGLFRYH